MKLADLPHTVLGVTGRNVAAGRADPQHAMRDLMNRRTAKPFDDTKARAQQPTQFKPTLAGNYSEAVALWQSALVMG